MATLESQMTRLTAVLNEAEYPVDLVSDTDGVVYSIESRDEIESIQIVPGDSCISVVLADPNRPVRIKVLEFDLKTGTVTEDLGDGDRQELQIR